MLSRLSEDFLGGSLKSAENRKLSQIGKLRLEIDKAKSRISNARRLMLDKEIDANEYREIKEEYEE